MNIQKFSRVVFVALVIVVCIFTLSGCGNSNLLGSWYLDVSNCSGTLSNIPMEMSLEKSGDAMMHNVVNVKNGEGYLVRNVIEYGTWKAENGAITITGPHGAMLIAFDDIDSAHYEIASPDSNYVYIKNKIYIVMPNGAKACYNIENSSFIYDTDTEVIDNR